jgi:hypothetical protein
MTLTAEQLKARDGKPYRKGGPTHAPLRERILRGMIPEPNIGCWLWLGYLRNSGYGLIGVGSQTDGSRTMQSVHKAAYETFIGPVPVGMVVRHKCDVKICVNPDHLAIGTQAQNLAEMVARGRNHWGAQAHCKNGHAFTPENTRLRSDGGRRCLACVAEGRRRRAC